MKNILVTGGAGFIGSNLIKRLFKDVKGATIVNMCMRPVQVCMAATRRCRLRWRTGWTTPCRSMPPPRRATSCLPTATRSSTTSHQLAFVFSSCMALPEGPTWPTSTSPTSCCVAKPSRSTTTATAAATSPTWMTLWKASCA